MTTLMLHRMILDLEKRVNQHNTQTFDTDSVLELNNVEDIIVSMVGGGGCGGYATIKNNMLYSGGGGGSGEGFLKKPISLKNSSKAYVQIQIGKGGNVNHPDGGDTILTIYDSDYNLIEQIVAKGGKGAISKFNKGGKSGFGHLNSDQNGSITLKNSTMTYAGNGGTSIFSEGGLAANQVYDGSKKLVKSVPKGTKASDGSYGSGGGGTSEDDQNMIGNGGDGFVIIEY